MKFSLLLSARLVDKVAPFTGAWIEILLNQVINLKLQVAPFTGAWIEILAGVLVIGLGFVAPFTGAWIEIFIQEIAWRKCYRRSLHGSVD